MPLESFAHAAYGAGVGTPECPDQPVATLRPGWYPDPHLRWKARYWDGRAWTDRGPCARVRIRRGRCSDKTPWRPPNGPKFGPNGPRFRSLPVAVTTRRRDRRFRADPLASRGGEVAGRGRRTWAGSGRRAQGAGVARAGCELPPAADRTRGRSSRTRSEIRLLVTIPDAVRVAALNELHTATLKQSGRTLKATPTLPPS